MTNQTYTYPETWLLAAIETTYGVNSVTGDADAILVRDLTPPALNVTDVERDVVRGFLGAKPSTATQIHRQAVYGVDLAGAGTAGQIPQWDRIIRAGMMQRTVVAAASIQASPGTKIGSPTGTFTYVTAGAYTGGVPRTVTLECTTAGGSGTAKFTVSSPARFGVAAINATDVTMTSGQAFALANGATITPTVGTAFALGDKYSIDLDPHKVEYRPVSALSDQESLAVWFGIGNQCRKMLGVRGKLTFDLSAGSAPLFKLEGAGKYLQTEVVAPANPSYAGWVDPVTASEAFTFVSLHGYSPVVKTLTANSGADFGYVERIGGAKIVASDRPWKGSITGELDNVGNFDWEARALSGVKGLLRVIHGDRAGNIVRIDMPNVQLRNPKLSKGDKNIWEVACDFSAIPTAANNEIVIAVM